MTAKTWTSYKKTYRNEADIFDFARCGDLRGLADILTSQPEFDFDEKNHNGYSALMLAVYNGQKDFCEALLRCGADVNSTDSVGNTLLMSAAFKGNLPIFELLLSYGAGTEYKNKSNMTVKDWAVMFKRTEIIDYLNRHYPNEKSSSKLGNIVKFIKLSFLLAFKKIAK
ncbi:ankyrin repeat domain-containing protein [Vibrio rarus]|uniref:ankyrin repeat domain-containing protein n=1 Tax=Vibrio rarus TaxID=413403 RepID=UPI0021C4B23D|nr:ankyrin repeat domain-containing protein [Vibrio rarus]